MMSVKFDEKNKLWTTANDPILYNPHISIAHMLLRSMELFGPKIAQINDDTGEQFTYEQLRMMTIRAAQNLQKRGYTTKQAISLNCGNIANQIPIVFASLSLGCPVNTMSTDHKPHILKTLELIEPKLLFCEVEKYDVTVECLKDLGMTAKIFVLNGTKGDAESVDSLFVETGTEEDFVPVECDGINEPAFILSTSGTSGPSKGVCLSHATFLSEVYPANFKMFVNGVILVFYPLSWISAVLNLIVSTLCGATRVQTTESFSIDMQLRIIEKYKVTYVENVPYDVKLILESGKMATTDLSSLKHMPTIGYKAPLAILKEFNDKLPNGNIHNLYGMTEMCDVSLDFPKFSGKETVGKLVNGVTVKVVDDKGNRCGINVNGEICVKPRFKFLGYYKNPELMAEIIDSEGFFLTGDVGHLDADGYLYIADRKKNVINCRDFWVYPFEVEEVLLRLPEIKGVCVVGVPYDAMFDVPAAVVERANGAKITEEDICKLVEDNLPKECKLIGGVYFIDALPKSTTGKPLHREVKELAVQRFNAKAKNGH